MKIRILTFVLLLLVCLSSCTFDAFMGESSNNEKPLVPVAISAEPLNCSVRKTKSFKIKVGIGQYGMAYSYAMLEIIAPGFVIISPDGSRYEETYTCEYFDFSDKKYRAYFNAKELNYLETFRFEYIGTEDDYIGEIDFVIFARKSEEYAGSANYVLGKSADVSYRVRGNRIAIAKYPPKYWYL